MLWVVGREVGCLLLWVVGREVGCLLLWVVGKEVGCLLLWVVGREVGCVLPALALGGPLSIQDLLKFHCCRSKPKKDHCCRTTDLISVHLLLP